MAVRKKQRGVLCSWPNAIHEFVSTRGAFNRGSVFSDFLSLDSFPRPVYANEMAENNDYFFLQHFSPSFLWFSLTLQPTLFGHDFCLFFFLNLLSEISHKEFFSTSAQRLKKKLLFLFATKVVRSKWKLLPREVKWKKMRIRCVVVHA